MAQAFALTRAGRCAIETTAVTSSNNMRVQPIIVAID